MNKYWLELRPSSKVMGEVEGTWQVRYSTPGLGFTVNEIVDDKTAHMLQVAIEFGKQQTQKTLREALGL